MPKPGSRRQDDDAWLGDESEEEEDAMGESTGLGDGEEGAVIGFKLEAVEGRARREARFCLTKGTSGRGEGEERGRLATD